MKKSRNKGVSQFDSAEPVLPENPTTGDMIRALNWYNAMWDTKKLITTINAYLKKKKIKKIIPSNVSVRTAGAIIRLIDRKQIPDNQVYLKDFLNSLETKAPPPKVKVIRPTIQESTAIKQNEYITGLDNLFERFLETGMTIYGMKSYLYDSGMKASYVQGCMDWAQSVYDEIFESMSDKELKEGYSNYTISQKKKILRFFDNMLKELGTYRDAVKPVRKKKFISPSKVVKKVQYLKEIDKIFPFDSRIIKSVAPENIIGAESVILFNTKTRMLSYYKSDGGLTVSGTTIKGFDESSTMKLRVPQVPGHLDAVTKLRKNGITKWFNTICSKKRGPGSGRITSDTLIMKAV